MPDTKITALTAIGANPIIPSTFPIPMVDLTDTSMAASGTTKKVTVNQILGAGGTATLASATITGDLTVRTTGLTTTASAVGINTASPTANTLTIGANRFIICSDSQSKFGDNGLINGAAADGNTQIQFFGSKSLFFNEGVSTRMTLNSTGLGIGLAPVGGVKLSVAGTIYANAGNALILDNPSSNFVAQIKNTGSSLQSTLAFLTGSGTSMLIDNSGNVGIGVTPANWATIKALQVGSGASLFGYTATEATLSGNTYYNAGFKYVANGQATQYQQQVGEHRWFNAPSGTAGNAITFTQAMTLDASGNLLVGRTAALGGKIGAQVEGGNGAAYLLRHNGATAGKYRIFAIDGSNNGLFYDQNNVGMYMADAGTAWIATSDETQKDIIEPISNAISKVGSLRAVIGKFKTDANSVRRSFLIAQDVQTALPEAVHQKDGLLGLSYTDVIPLLVAAIKELTAEVNALKNA